MHRKKEAWVISVDMGYGHQRAAYPLKDIAFERIITANSDKIISARERKDWHRLRSVYEFISRMEDAPVVGRFFFGLYDIFQRISPLFPFRDLSKPNIAVYYFRMLILRRHLCRSLIEYIRQRDIPVITTHFAPALAAHYLGMKEIYCVITDTDINRAWVPIKPGECNIKYLAPCKHAVRRLKEYGLSDRNIILTGFPLPEENIGISSKTLKQDLFQRLANLDTKNAFIPRYADTIKKTLGEGLKAKKRPLTITYMVGGAGAQKDIGIKIICSLSERILRNEVVVNLVAGTRLDVKAYFEHQLRSKNITRGVNIIFALDKKGYFASFNKAIRTTDVLWSKPSEVSFYTGLGIPIIIAPPVGSHEKYNREWLMHTGSGLVQEKPEYVNDWLFYWLDEGRLAEAAWNGFSEAGYKGTENIKNAVFGSS